MIVLGIDIEVQQQRALWLTQRLEVLSDKIRFGSKIQKPKQIIKAIKILLMNFNMMA